MIALSSLQKYQDLAYGSPRGRALCSLINYKEIAKRLQLAGCTKYYNFNEFPKDVVIQVLGLIIFELGFFSRALPLKSLVVRLEELNNALNEIRVTNYQFYKANPDPPEFVVIDRYLEEPNAKLDEAVE